MTDLRPRGRSDTAAPSSLQVTLPRPRLN